MYKLDLHTHSEASPDGSLKLTDYQKMLTQGHLSYIAITDHNTISFALKAQEQLGGHIIVGEEILTLQGEIIGLFLQKVVPAGLSVQETIDRIRDQAGIVYVPHPFDTMRHSLSEATLNQLDGQIEIVEIYNGRAVMKHSTPLARDWVRLHHVCGAASSDAHGLRGWGRTYSAVSEPPTQKNLLQLLRDASLSTQSVGARGRLYPKLNRLRKKRHYDQ